MIVGCPKEIKLLENRVGLIPATVKSLVAHGATVLVERGAGLGSAIQDHEYEAAGALLVDGPERVWRESQIIAKVKEPLEQEFSLFQEGQIIYTFLHLAAEAALAEALLKKRVTSVAFETIEIDGKLPLLKPMSEVAGRMSIQAGAMCLENQHGGRGVLLGGVPGVSSAHVVILGGGVVGKNAAKMAVGLGARVSILDINAERLEALDDLFRGRVQTIFSSPHSIEEQISTADLVIGAVLVPGARAPRLITKEMLKLMRVGAAIVDVAIDQGGCVETIHRTMHDRPTYIVDGIVHYGVANMPGAVASTSTFALSHATAPFLLQIAQYGLKNAISVNPGLELGINTCDGHVTQKQVAEALEKPYRSTKEFF